MQRRVAWKPSAAAPAQSIGRRAGKPGFIDRPYEKPNLAASMALASLPLHLSSPAIVKPKAEPPFDNWKIELTPQDATIRVKGLAKHLGAELVGFRLVCDVRDG